MTPTPKVAKVAPRCSECSGTDGLIGRWPRYVCMSCVRVKVRLDEIARTHDDNAREGWR